MSNFFLRLYTQTRSPRFPSSPQSDELSQSQSSPTSRPIEEVSPNQSDTELASLYRKYRHSASSGGSTPEVERCGASSAHLSFTVGDDAAGLPRRTAVLDELNFMLGEAIGAAHSAFDTEPDNSLPGSLSYSSLLSGVKQKLGAEKDECVRRTQAEDEHDQTQKLEQEQGLDRPRSSASSVSDYSDRAQDLTDGEVIIELDAQQELPPDPALPVAPNQTPKPWPQAPDCGIQPSPKTRLTQLSAGRECHPSLLLKPRLTSSPIQEAIEFPMSERAQSGSSCAESSAEVLSTTAIEESSLAPTRRVGRPKQTAALPQHSPEAPHSIKTYPQRLSSALMQSLRSPSDPSPAGSPRTPRKQSHELGMSTRTLIADEERSGSLTSSPAKTLTARSPVVKRSSSDLSCLEQWQWLESQYSSEKKPPTRETRPHARERAIQALDAHFSRTGGLEEIAFKRKLLAQRQHALGPAQRSTGTRLKPPRAPGAWSEGVPTINVKEMKRVKSAAERCRLYGAALEALGRRESGLDVWVWMKTCGEGPDGGPQVADGSRARARPAIHKLSYPTLTSAAEQAPGSLPAHLREVSQSSVATFPLRGNAQKAIQIQAGAEGQLVELVEPDGRTRPGLNSLMELHNLPFPGLYPHSAAVHRAPHQAPHHNGNGPPDFSGYSFGNGAVPLRAGQEPAAPRTPGFFSQIGRRNSAKLRASHSGSGSSGVSKPLVISGPMIVAPSSGPKGPRPDHLKISTNPNLSQSSGRNPSYSPSTMVATGRRTLKKSYQQYEPQVRDREHLLLAADRKIGSHQASGRSPLRLGAGSTPPSEVVSSKLDGGMNMLNMMMGMGNKKHRMSFAYGSQQLPPQVEVVEQERLQVGGRRTTKGSNGIGKGVNQDGKINGLTNGNGVANLNQQDVNLEVLDDLIGRNNHNHSQDVGRGAEGRVFEVKLNKLMDILPFADRVALGRVLRDQNGDDVAAIGAYLELEQGKK